MNTTLRVYLHDLFQYYSTTGLVEKRVKHAISCFR